MDMLRAGQGLGIHGTTPIHGVTTITYLTYVFQSLLNVSKFDKLDK